jgi:hypothetical protein
VGSKVGGQRTWEVEDMIKGSRIRRDLVVGESSKYAQSPAEAPISKEAGDLITRGIGILISKGARFRISKGARTVVVDVHLLKITRGAKVVAGSILLKVCLLVLRWILSVFDVYKLITTNMNVRMNLFAINSRVVVTWQ